MRGFRGSKGFSFVEVVLVVVIIAVGFSALAATISNLTMGNIDLDNSMTAVFLARERMSETKARDFDSIASVSSTSFGGDFARYSYQVDVDYVEPADLDQPVAGPTDHKRIVVTVSADEWPGSVRLYNLKTDTDV